MTNEKAILLLDMESFYASIEHAENPQYAGKPLVVSGDPNRRSGVILAACPLAKEKGIQNAERLYEAQQKCSDVVVVKPRMQKYVDVSLRISKLLGEYTDLIEPTPLMNNLWMSPGVNVCLERLKRLHQKFKPVLKKKWV